MSDWLELLERISIEYIDSQEDLEELPPEMVESKWLGHPGASEDQILRTESRLGLQLPHSYREFLKISNGWSDFDRTFNFHLLPVEHIDWLIASEPGVADLTLDQVDDEDYFVYGREQDCIYYRPEYLPMCLKISNNYWDTAIILLNPEISLVEGEWEAWCLDSKLPGANRYKTFWDLMMFEPSHI